MMSDTGPNRKVCFGLAAILVQALFVPAAFAKKPIRQELAAATPAPEPAPEPPPTPAPAAEPAPPLPPEAQAPQPEAAPGSPEMQAPTAEMFESSTIEVVKVTVDRREQDIQKYAGSANAFSQDDLERIGVSSVKQVSVVAPSVEVGVQEGNTEVYIRGLGSNNNTELGDPSASTHIDGIYIPRPRGVGSMFFDLERLEINRGPQGTLRGRNSLAGSLNIITAKPKLGEFASEASVQMGNYSQRLARGMVNIPFGDRLALRIAAMGETHDPFYKNAGPNYMITPAESADTYATRVSAKFVPVDPLTINASFDYTQEKGTGASGSAMQRALVSGILPSEIKDRRSVLYSGVHGMQNMRQWGVRGEVTYDVGPVLVQYLGGYRDLDYRQIISGYSPVWYNGIMDDPQTDLDKYDASYWHTTSKSQVHELRIFAPDKDRLRWTLGGFFFREKQFAFLGNTVDKIGGFQGVEFNMPDVKGQSEAGYLDATFDISKVWRALGGVRITHETKSRRGIGNIYYMDFKPGPYRYGTEGFQWKENGRPQYNGPDPDSSNPYNMGMHSNSCTMLYQGIETRGVNDNFSGHCSNEGGMQPQNGSYGATFFDFRVGTDYDLAPGHLAYLTFSTGHASGGFNDNLIAKGATPDKDVNTITTYKPEVVYAIEVGSKNEFFDRKIKSNISVFDYEYWDYVLQSVVSIDTPNVGPGQSASFAGRSNIARARILGLELENDFRLPYGLMASLNATFLYSRAVSGSIFDGRMDYGPVVGRESDKTDIKGKTLPRSPAATVNLALSQHYKTSVGYFDWLVSGQVRTKQYFTIFNGEGYDSAGNVVPRLSDYQPTYFRADIGVGYTRPDGKTRLEAFVNNVTDVAYMTSLISSKDTHNRYYNPPRQIGTRLTLLW